MNEGRDSQTPCPHCARLRAAVDADQERLRELTAGLAESVRQVGQQAEALLRDAEHSVDRGTPIPAQTAVDVFRGWAGMLDQAVREIDAISL